MKKLFFILLLSFSCYLGLWAQLPPVAQALYDSAYAHDSGLVSYALSNGAEIKATPDGNSFYLQWFPPAATPSNTPLVVSLHGSHCNAFMEFKSWFTQAQSHSCGIIALQWYRYTETVPIDYFPDDTLFSYIDSALTRINYSTHKALLHGFSRGSARSYAMIFYDITKGTNYFCTSISNSGGADLGYPLYHDINIGMYGTNVFAGKHWNLFCGGLDTSVGCSKMINTKTWLEAQGASVDIFIQAPLADHDGFQLPSGDPYKDSILNQYLLCFDGVSTIDKKEISNSFSFSPNPFSSQTTLHCDVALNNASLQLIDLYGQIIQNNEGLSGNNVVLNFDNFSSGVYFVRLSENGHSTMIEKLILLE